MQNRVFKISNASLFFFLFLPFLLVAQNGTKSFQKEFNWEKADETKTILIDVKSGTEMLKMDFEGNISQGDLQLKVYDPEGNKVAGFSLKTSGSDGGSVHVGASDGNGSNSNSNSNTSSGSNSSSNSNATVMTTKSESGNSTVTVKSKSKSKNKKGKSNSVTSTSSDSKSAKGIMKKKISNPMPGKWKFVLEVKNVSGNLSADIDQY